MKGLVLSLFPGIDLLGHAFELSDWCVVRGPDHLWGGDIATFEPPAGRFDGIIAGPPYQDFSTARRSEPTGDGIACFAQLNRVIEQAEPYWFLVECVTMCPDVQPKGYFVQRLNLNARECGLRQNRLRAFQFGSRRDETLAINRFPPPAGPPEKCVMAGEGQRSQRRSWPDFCEAQGLLRSFDLPAFTLSAKYRAVGNGVPIAMGLVLANAIWHREDNVLGYHCACGCGRETSGRRSTATPSCRKRMERRRRAAAGVTGPGAVTIEEWPCPRVLRSALERHGGGR